MGAGGARADQRRARVLCRAEPRHIAPSGCAASGWRPRALAPRRMLKFTRWPSASRHVRCQSAPGMVLGCRAQGSNCWLGAKRPLRLSKIHTLLVRDHGLAASYDTTRCAASRGKRWAGIRKGPRCGSKIHRQSKKHSWTSGSWANCATPPPAECWQALRPLLLRSKSKAERRARASCGPEWREMHVSQCLRVPAVCGAVGGQRGKQAERSRSEEPGCEYQ